jgi:hypothetical protein
VPSEESDLAEETERSWDIYEEVHRSYPEAIVIGGWASWLHNRAAKSHDIDIVVGPEDLAHMRQALELTESSHLGSPKWRGTYDEIHLDVYVTHRSRLGRRLQLPVEHLVEHRQDFDGYPTLNKEALLVAKSAARLDRPDTLPGRKDAEDMALMLLKAPDPWRFRVVYRVARFSLSPDASGSNLVLEAVAGLADEAPTTQRARALDRIAREMRAAFAEFDDQPDS